MERVWRTLHRNLINYYYWTRHLPMDNQAIVFNHQIDSNRCKTPRKLAKNCPQQSKLQYRFGDTDVTQSELDSLQIWLISPLLYSPWGRPINPSPNQSSAEPEHFVAMLRARKFDPVQMEHIGPGRPKFRSIRLRYLLRCTGALCPGAPRNTAQWVDFLT